MAETLSKTNETPPFVVARIPDYAPGGLPWQRGQEQPAALLPEAGTRAPDTQIREASQERVGREPRSEAEQAPRITRIGRVATEAFSRTTPKGQPVAGFQLAVHDQEDQTSYYTVLGFGDRAARLHDAVQKGQTLEVTGYLHTREKRGANGHVRLERSIYAVAWGTPQAARSPV